MDKVRSLEHYKELLACAKKNGYRLSNCFFLPDAVRQKVSEEKLFFRPIENGLLLVEDNGDFYRCFYYLSEQEPSGNISLDKDAVIEFPFNGFLNEKQQLQIKKIEALGFHLGRESSVMSSLPEQLIACCPVWPDQICCPAEAKDSSQILALINSCFNPLYSFLPAEDELLGLISEGRVFVIHDGEKLAAALISSFEKKVATIRQVAVDPAYRGNKLGKIIVQAYHDKYMGEASSFQHWVDINNIPAVKLYLGFGYSFGLRKANEYISIKKGENES